MSSETYEVVINDLDRKGSGRGAVWRDPGTGNKKKLKLTVPLTLPGETVQVTVDHPWKKRWWTRPDQILTKNKERTEAPCPHFTRCGGCAWQHWTYEGQLSYKTEEVKRMLAEQGFSADLVHDAKGMSDPWHYRNKMEFTFSKEGEMGLHEQGNFRKIVALDTCLIAGGEMVNAALTVASWAAEYGISGYNKETHEGLLRHVMVRQSFAAGEVMLGIGCAADWDGELEEPVRDLISRIESRHPEVKSLLWMKNTDWADKVQAEELTVLSGRSFIYEKLSGFRFRLWHDTFFQTNPYQAEVLVDTALKMAEPGKGDRMIDLFCGVGTFSLPFARKVDQLAGIEIVPASIESAERNAEENGITNTRFLAKDARKGMDEMLEVFGAPDLLMLDPPRSGAGGKVMRRIGRAGPEKIVYVSCNPETFADDITQLVPFGYELKEVQPVDMFPHTVHIELVAVLTKTAETNSM
ncbi:23S rRNA (uracil(1939)-C(5))-methyltransferase RlmD [Alkalicoccus urumqiensis]|uniref:23S rRNA (Uracil(1939)-C(5))-methyltransferase RlmD n=1 Tax=Alkalicoccus urumqiensis TaxID=1548213 RepID=A0A2P6MEK6_ALKUR|nr:23S rRNA (uracil(1939)-C(5))-methyltransferase RlmD [Alkalicoccus urumqiensis]PRO64735.1 23S rRNA (uracil(1939)-C(5))-methyltransferase RlmD [Alkalicoccus urumqiensis]